VTYTVTASAGREFQQQIVNLNFSSLAADPTGTRLYGIIQATGTTAAQLDQVDPATGSVTASVSVPAYPTQIVVSGDGQYVYLMSPQGFAATSAPPEVTRVNAATMSVDFTISPTQQYQEMTLAIPPQNPRTWALCFFSESSPTQPIGYAVEVFDDAVARPQSWVDPDSAAIAWTQRSPDASTLYILTSHVLQAAPVTQSGLSTGSTLLTPVPNVQAGFSVGPMQQVAGLLYSEGGGVANPTTGAIVGQYIFDTPLSLEAESAYLSIDTANNRVIAAYGPPGTLQSFDLSTFTSIWIARLPVGSPPIRWGTNGLAFLGPGADTSALYLISGTFVAPASSSGTQHKH
jgi:DNA-binding beta-propeller fold protein YncE